MILNIYCDILIIMYIYKVFRFKFFYILRIIHWALVPRRFRGWDFALPRKQGKDGAWGKGAGMKWGKSDPSPPCPITIPSPCFVTLPLTINNK